MDRDTLGAEFYDNRKHVFFSTENVTLKILARFYSFIINYFSTHVSANP